MGQTGAVSRPVGFVGLDRPPPAAPHALLRLPVRHAGQPRGRRWRAWARASEAVEREDEARAVGRGLRGGAASAPAVTLRSVRDSAIEGSTQRLTLLVRY